MLRKQREQINQSVCYDINQITEWHHLMKVRWKLMMKKYIGVGIREQEQDTRQVLFQSLVSNLLTETILETQLEDDTPFQTMYVELFGLLKKAIDYATKADMQHELLNIFKAFIYDIQSRLEVLTNINNPIIVKHKG
ncbi:unnamed protein product [Rhizophagus irregularis]|nr:unnamed protein product [Rhizophagus irregularis]